MEKDLRPCHYRSPLVELVRDSAIAQRHPAVALLAAFPSAVIHPLHEVVVLAIEGDNGVSDPLHWATSCAVSTSLVIVASPFDTIMTNAAANLVSVTRRRIMKRLQQVQQRVHSSTYASVKC